VADYANQKFALNQKNVNWWHVAGAAATNGVFAGVSNSLFTNVRNASLWANVNKNFIQYSSIHYKAATAAAFDGVANFVNNVLWDEVDKVRSNSVNQNINQINLFNLMNQSLNQSSNSMHGFITVGDGPQMEVPFGDPNN